MSYLGSKAASGVYQAIIALMPPHDTYIETHLGGGTVMARKPAALRSIGVEINRPVLDAYAGPYPIERHCVDAIAFLEQFDFSSAGRVLVYADPPYLLSTRISRKRYLHEYTVGDHVRLVNCLRDLPCAVILSGYPSDLYSAMMPSWRTVELQAMTRGGVRTEKIWMNFPVSASHWATYAGKNFTDRQRIKRKAARWASNFCALSGAERVAVLAALLEASALPDGADLAP